MTDKWLLLVRHKSFHLVGKDEVVVLPLNTLDEVEYCGKKYPKVPFPSDMQANTSYFFFKDGAWVCQCVSCRSEPKNCYRNMGFKQWYAKNAITRVLAYLREKNRWVTRDVIAKDCNLRTCTTARALRYLSDCDAVAKYRSSSRKVKRGNEQSGIGGMESSTEKSYLVRTYWGLR